MIRLILTLIILTVVVILAIANKEYVQLNYIFGTTSPLPLYLILGGTFIVSGLIFTIILLPAWVKDKMELRRLKRTIRQIEAGKGGAENRDDADIVSLDRIRHKLK